MTKKITLGHLTKNIFAVGGFVLIWRGIWYILDWLDKWLCGGSHFWSSLAGIVIGVIILYIADKDLKRIEKA